MTLSARAQPPENTNLLSHPEAWQTVASDGVKIVLGTENKSLRVDFDFTSGAGYGGAFLNLPIDLPENYEFAMTVRGEGPANNLELKLADPKGLDVWWVNRRAFEFPANSTRLINLRRHFQFAWGPSGGAELKRLGKVELIIAAAEGGKGTLWIEDFTFTPKPPVKPYTGTPTIARSDGEISIDFQEPREIGGVVLKWKDNHAPADVVVETWEGNARWNRTAELRNILASSSYIALPDLQTQQLRVRATQVKDISDIEFLDPQTGSSPNALRKLRASHSRQGLYPRNLLGKQSFWTIVGVPDDDKEAIINEEGQIEVERRGFSIEPFVMLDGKLLTWADGKHVQSLEDGWIPVPSVIRKHEGVELQVKALATGKGGNSTLHAAYTLKNTSTARQKGSIVLAVRPFQVLPPWQDLNITGGWTPIKSIATDLTGLIVNGSKHVIVSEGFRASAATYDMGDAVELLAEGKPMPESSVTCPQKSASGLLQWEFSLAPGESKSVFVCVPFHDTPTPADQIADIAAFEQLVQATSQRWMKAIASDAFQLPPAAKQFRDTLLATQAYILINHNGKGFQPGSRTYFRSWIRDGSMTSAAMLELGHPDLVKRFIDYYAPYEFPNGKVPCVVDKRGPDPVAENDSHGQLIWLIANYYRYTHDKDLVQRHFARVKKTVEYIESLRAQRLTDEFSASGPARQEPGKPPVPALAFRGLVPESISHEGYSAKPMHSFWDQFYVLRGLKDAAYLATVMDEKDLAQRWSTLADDFRNSLLDSIRLVQKTHGIDHLPGCVEFGDFDSTSSTIILWPVDEGSRFPREWIEATFNRYWTEFEKRKASTTWEAYTPYELRHIGALVRLGEKDRAWKALDFYLSHQRPQGWREWAEVVWRDRDTPKMIGDMPHTWCGSDFLNSARSMFLYEDEAKERLVLFAGVPEEWLSDPSGVGFTNLRSEFGTVSASTRMPEKQIVSVRIEGDANPKGGFEIRSPIAKDIQKVFVNGEEIKFSPARSVMIPKIPADVELRY